MCVCGYGRTDAMHTYEVIHMYIGMYVGRAMRMYKCIKCEHLFMGASGPNWVCLFSQSASALLKPRTYPPYLPLDHR